MWEIMYKYSASVCPTVATGEQYVGSLSQVKVIGILRGEEKILQTLFYNIRTEKKQQGGG